jgi:putative nucleotidyltransferase with HDIG domain
VGKKVKFLRPLLLRLLVLTDAPPAGARRERAAFFRRDYPLPPALVMGVVWGMLFVVLLLELGRDFRMGMAAFLLAGLLIGFFQVYLKQDHPTLVRDEEALALLGLLVVFGVWGLELWAVACRFFPGTVSPFGFPMAAVSILTSLLLHPRLAVAVTVALSLLFGVIHGFTLEGPLVLCIGGMTAVHRCLEVRKRDDILKAGLWAAAGQMIVAGLLSLMQSWERPETVLRLEWAMAGGVVSALSAMAVLPSLENFFSRLTSIRLLELSDVNHPLLKRMSLEAPGTFHHSLIMASLASSAAEAIGADALLCRVGAYFHDIGKLVKPEYFVENQSAIGNPHDPLPPNLSRLVIQSHVKDGLALAEKHGLHRKVADFVAMHHGTSRIEFFYRRALEREDQALSVVDEDDYRYPGPRPHSAETAIVMMSDGVEASVRAMEEPTPQRIRDQVKTIVDTKMADGQFEDVPLTLAQVQMVMDSFVYTLAGIYHVRVRYPEAKP